MQKVWYVYENRCPAIMKTKDNTFSIKADQCVGCAVCTQMCKFDAIKLGGKN